MLDEELRASVQDGTYPRPQLVRPRWLDLSGEWDFAFDDDVDGRRTNRHPRRVRPDDRRALPARVAPLGHQRHRVPPRRLVPPPRRQRPSSSAPATPTGRTLLLHFGAVDYRADVWIDGRHVASHEGGHTPVHRRGARLRTAGSRSSCAPRTTPTTSASRGASRTGSSSRTPSGTTARPGIWQPVWLESVPRQHVTRVAWRPDIPNDRVHLTLELAARPTEPARAHVTLHHGEQQLAEVTVTIAGLQEQTAIAIPALGDRAGVRRAAVDARAPGPHRCARGAHRRRQHGRRRRRTSACARSRPWEASSSSTAGPTRSAASSRRGTGRSLIWLPRQPAALRAEVELIKELGFTTARLHQKVEDPRLMYWADRLGLLVWTEMPSAFEHSDAAVMRLTREWTDVIRRDSSHPSVVAWVPLNESWAVRHVAVDAAPAGVRANALPPDEDARRHAAGHLERRLGAPAVGSPDDARLRERPREAARALRHRRSGRGGARRDLALRQARAGRNRRGVGGDGIRPRRPHRVRRRELHARSRLRRVGIPARRARPTIWTAI